MRRRSVLGRSVLRITGEAALPAMASVLAELSGRLFSALTNADAPLAGPIYALLRTCPPSRIFTMIASR